MGKFILDRAKGYARSLSKPSLRKASTSTSPSVRKHVFPRLTCLSQPHEFQPVFDAFPEIRLTLDVGHANLGGGKNRSSEFIRLYGYRIGHVHANDNFGKEDAHLPSAPGSSISKDYRELKDVQYDETITLEELSPGTGLPQDQQRER